MRVISSIVLIALALAVLFAGGGLLTAWIGIVGLLAAREWHEIAFGRLSSPLFMLHLVGFIAFVVLCTLKWFEWALAATLAISALGFGVVVLAKQRPYWAAVGVPYTLLPCVALSWLRAEAVPGLETILWLMGVVWASDISAFIAGRTIGGPKLAPLISPRKTWAGLAGAMAGAALVGVAVGLHVPGASPVWLGGLSAILAVVSQLGDLTESAFKRRFGVKDSSQLIPGQGGMLDRVDGLVFVALAVAGLVWLRGGQILTVGVQ